MPTSEITFSVVIAAYNAEATIAKAIDSCLQQSYPPHEIIVVNDCSTDATQEILDGYGNSIQCITMLKNNGPSLARNKGMNAAKGNYIAFLDADDIWHIDKLQIVASVLSSAPNTEFLYHPFSLHPITEKDIPESATLYKLPFVKLLLSNPIATPCAIIKNNSAFRFEETMRYMEDYDLWLKIAHKKGAYFVNVPLTQLGRPVLSAGGASASKWLMRKGELRAYRRLARLNPLYTLLLPILYPFSIAKHFYKMMSGNN